MYVDNFLIEIMKVEMASANCFLLSEDSRVKQNYVVEFFLGHFRQWFPFLATQHPRKKEAG